MSTQNPTPSPPPESQPDLTLAYQNFTHYTALGFLFGAPIIIALPPRKLDIYTFALGGGFVISASHLLNERERKRMIRMSKSPFGGDPSAAATWAGSGDSHADENKALRHAMVQSQLQREKDDVKRRARLLDSAPNNADNFQQQQKGQEREGKEEEERRPTSAIGKSLEKAWMGDEKPGWKQRRLAEEQEKISHGEGYWSMIVDQIWEVWNWGKEKSEELEEKDRQALWERKEKETDSRGAEDSENCRERR